MKNKLKLTITFILFFVIGYIVAQPPCSNSCSTCPGNLVCIGCNCQAVTPIELTDYQCVTDNNSIKLIWTTVSETNNQEFQIFRSFNAINYTKISTIPGMGTNSFGKSYEIIDFKPFLGINYYRLVQKDYNGVESVLKTIFCSLNDNSDYLVTYSNLLGQNISFNEISIGLYVKEFSKDNIIVKREIYYKL